MQEKNKNCTFEEATSISALDFPAYIKKLRAGGFEAQHNLSVR